MLLSIREFTQFFPAEILKNTFSDFSTLA